MRKAVTVPAGEYRLGTVSLSFDDPQGGPRWSFIFSDNGGTSDHKWYRVEKGGTVEIDPIGKLVLQTSLEDRSKELSGRRRHPAPAQALTPATGF